MSQEVGKSWFAYWEARRLGQKFEDRHLEPPLYIEDKLLLALAGKRRLVLARGAEVVKKVAVGILEDTGIVARMTIVAEKTGVSGMARAFFAGAVEGARQGIVFQDPALTDKGL